MGHRERKKTRWRIVVTVAMLALALLSCAVLIALDVRKVAEEKKIERKFSPKGTPPEPASTFAPQPQSDDD